MKSITLIALILVTVAALGFSRLSTNADPTSPTLTAKEIPATRFAKPMESRVTKLPARELFQITALVFTGIANEDLNICKGLVAPCTGIAFSDIDVVAGELKTRRLEFALPEGRLSDGTFLEIAGAPKFIPGERYLMFARAGAWHLTPVANWSHGVFREVKIVSKEKKNSAEFFVSEQGRVVTQFDEKGFHLGPRIAPPEGLLRVPAKSSGGGTSGVAFSRPPKINDEVKAALISGDSNAIAQLGMSAKSLKETIAQQAKAFGLNKSEPVHLKPVKNVTLQRQTKPAATDPGMEKAVPETLQTGPEFRGRGRDLEFETRREVEKPHRGPASAGTKKNIGVMPRSGRRSQ